MLCLNCHQAREVESETPGVRKYARCSCGAISIISELDFARREFGLTAGSDRATSRKWRKEKQA